MSSRVSSLRGREVFDSRGTPTVEAEIVFADGAFGRGIAPSGASVGRYEAVELRDGDVNRFGGKGVLKAKASVDGEIASAVEGRTFESQSAFDRTLIDLDASVDKGRLGANALLACSSAFASARAASSGLPLFASLGGENARLLPTPMLNILNGGVHADNRVDVQEFMILPASATSFREAFGQGVEVYHALKDELRRGGHASNVGDEGGFAPNFRSSRECIEAILSASVLAGLDVGRDLLLALDCAAGELLDDRGRYVLRGEGMTLSSDEMCRYLSELVREYPIRSIEDPMGDDDWDGWRVVTDELGDVCQLVGDDLFVTNPSRLRLGCERECANAILVKPNQIGTLTETFEAISSARESGYAAIASHRSGETEDSSIADIAVASGCGQIKTGATARADRTAKYNRLLRIEDMLGERALFNGSSPLAPRPSWRRELDDRRG